MKIYVAGLLAAVALGAALPASARSITGVEFSTSGAMTTVDVTFEAGAAGDNHALYVAYAPTDRGATLADWTAFQRVGFVAADATSAHFTLLPQLVDDGNTVCRVFLVESIYPFDTRIEAIRQSTTKTQYIDTGINAGPTTFASLDFQFDSTATTQQRIFGVASDDGTSLFSFDTYINGGGLWASACRDGSGDWTATEWAASPTRLTMSLDAVTGIHWLSNHVSHATTSKTHTGARTATSAGAITIFARRSFGGGTPQIHLFATGGLIYGGVISNENALVRNYLPCALGERAGLYDTVSRTIFWSAAANDDFQIGGASVPCAPDAGETQVAVSEMFDLNAQIVGSIWKGTVSGYWNTSDANWTIDGTANQAWANGGDAIFNDSASIFAVTNNTTVTPASTTFNHTQDYTLAGDGGIAGTGTFVKRGNGTLTISGVNHSFTGDMLLAGGTIVLTGDKDLSNITSGSLGNPRVARTVAVSNATLRVRGKNPFVGGGRSSTRPQVALKLYNSTLDLPPDFAFNVGDLHLHDTAVIFRFGLNTGNRWGSLFAENLYFSGTSPMTFAPITDGTATAVNEIGLLLGKFAQATIDVPDITGNANVDVFIRMPFFKANANDVDSGVPSGFRKTGAGTLELGYCDLTGFNNSDYTGNVDVVEGTVKMTIGGASLGANHASAFGSSGKPHTFTVHPGATLQLSNSDLQGQFYGTNAITIHVNGGALKQDNGIVNALGHLILENASFTYQGIRTQNNYYSVSADGTKTNHVPVIWPTIGFNGGVEFLGTNVYTLANGNKDGVHSHLFFGTCDGKPSDCYVAEISGRGTADETTDVTINARLEDAPPWYSFTEVDGKRYIKGFNQGLSGLPLNMRKTGPGILVLNSKLSTTTGRIEVAEGTLKMGGGMGSGEANFECPTNTYLGDLRDPNRVALVLNGGTLWIVSNDTFGQANTVNRSLFAVTNGTIRTIATSCTAFPALDLYDATLDYNAANTGNGSDIAAAHPWGTYIFSQRVHFDGTRPYDLQNVGGACYFSLGWQSDSYQVPAANGYTEQHGKTEFCVENITQDANPDVTIGVVLKVPDRWNGRTTETVTNKLYSKTNFRTGLLKTGLGTLRLNCVNDEGKYYTEATRVNGGTLLVDSLAFKSTNVFVQAGAYLGGTGTVLRATIEAGGGFTAAPDQTEALTLNAVELPPSGEVTLDVPYTGDVANLESVRVPVVKSIAGLEGAKWRVTMNGATVPEGYVGMANVRNGVVYGVIARGGTYIIFR